jgi:hypothetical protein
MEKMYWLRNLSEGLAVALTLAGQLADLLGEEVVTQIAEAQERAADAYRDELVLSGRG